MTRGRAQPAHQPGHEEAGPGLSLAEVADLAGVPQGSLRQARDQGLLPPPDAVTGCWPAAAVQDIRRHWPQIATELQAAQELGARRCAELLARSTGLAVRHSHVERLADRGMLTPTRTYRHRPLYRVADVQALADDPVGRALLSEIVSGRPG